MAFLAGATTAGTSCAEELFRRDVAGRNQTGKCSAHRTSQSRTAAAGAASPEPPAPPPTEEPAVAILKSGVVDGMAYTLYVDGSIEAELPQGTLRFASINDLRSHLAKNS